MIIHLCQEFSANDVSVLGRVASAVHDLGHTVGGAWSDETSERSPANSVQPAAKSIEQSEMIIAEATGASAFSVGYEVALALQSKKPILILMRAGSEPSYAAGIKSEFVTIRSYSEFTVEKIVKDFVKDNDSKTKDLRFNFVIDRKIYNYLRLKSFKSGKTKAEVVRDLLLDDIQKSEKKDS
jgi:hypothetical protein